MRDGAVLLEVDVEAVGVEVLGDHLARLDDAGLLGQVSLGEVLRRILHQQLFKGCKWGRIAYDLIRRPVGQLLSDQLVGPLLGLVTGFGGHTWDDERHGEGVFVGLVFVKVSTRAMRVRVLSLLSYV